MPRYAVDFVADVQELTTCEDISESVDLQVSSFHNILLAKENNAQHSPMGNKSCLPARVEYNGRHIVVSRGIQCGKSKVVSNKHKNISCQKDNQLNLSDQSELSNSSITLSASCKHVCLNNANINNCEPSEHRVTFQADVFDPPALRDSTKFKRKPFNGNKNNNSDGEDDIDIESLSATISNFSLHEKSYNGNIELAKQMAVLRSRKQISPHKRAVKLENFNNNGNNVSNKTVVTAFRKTSNNEEFDLSKHITQLTNTSNPLKKECNEIKSTACQESLEKKRELHNVFKTEELSMDTKDNTLAMTMTNLKSSTTENNLLLRPYANSTVDKSYASDKLGNSSSDDSTKIKHSVCFTKGSEEVRDAKKFRPDSRVGASNNSTYYKKNFVHFASPAKIKLENETKNNNKRIQYGVMHRKRKTSSSLHDIDHNYSNIKDVVMVDTTSNNTGFQVNPTDYIEADRRNQGMLLRGQRSNSFNNKSSSANDAWSKPPVSYQGMGSSPNAVTRPSRTRVNSYCITRSSPQQTGENDIEGSLPQKFQRSGSNTSITRSTQTICRSQSVPLSPPNSRNSSRATRMGSTKPITQRFYLPESANIEQILSDPSDRRIKAICDRHHCDIEVYSKVPKSGFLMNIILLAAPNQENLRKCVRALDCSLRWCLTSQLR